MSRVLVIALMTFYLSTAGASAQSGKYQIGGMQVTALSGPYMFQDATTKDWLRGYISEKPGSTPKKPAPTEIVNFHVCNTETILYVEFKQLQDGPPCRTFNPGPWAAWTVKNGKLVASGPTGQGSAIDFSALPSNLQSTLKTSKQYEIGAFSFPSPTGTTTLGIITKPNF